MPAPVYVTVRLSRLNLDAIDAEDIDDHSRALFHMLALLTHEETAAAAGKKSVPVRVSLDAVMELLAGAVAEGGDAFFGLTGAANTHPSANAYLDQLGNHVRGHCLLHGWERLAAHALALIVLLRAGEAGLDASGGAGERRSHIKKGNPPIDGHRRVCDIPLENYGFTSGAF